MDKKANQKPMKVSVYCMTFNHENYIRDTLEGFINQETDFGFEILVHDDASADNTRKIIQEYAEKYPDIIVPVLQEENQYSKGINIEKEYIFPKLQGQYVAVCEGDDYWCDPHKLQKQVDFLDNHPEYSACVHNTQVLDMYKEQKRLLNSSTQPYDLQIEHVLLDGGADFHTSSVFYRMEFGKEIYSEHCPDFFNKSMEVGDYPLAIFLVLKGKVRYFPDVMSVYRLGTPDSWTDRMRDIKMQMQTERELIDILKSVDEYTNCELHAAIQPIREKRLLRILNKGTQLNVLKSKELYEVFKRQTLTTRIKIRIKLLFLNKIRYRKM